MNFSKVILEQLLTMYERRGHFDTEVNSLRAVQFEIRKVFTAYTDRYNHETYLSINQAIKELLFENMIDVVADSSGNYLKIKLNLSALDKCYKCLQRKTVPEQVRELMYVIEQYRDSQFTIIARLVHDWQQLLKEYKKLPYDLKFNAKRTAVILKLLVAILSLRQESYIRNFSTAMFNDSKMFQKEYQSCIESILCDYTNEIIDKTKILAYYNLYENPSYLLVKGDITIEFATSFINVAELKDGITLANSSLESIKQINVPRGQVVTVENLPTYHDVCSPHVAYIYSGGYSSRSVEAFLSKLYRDNRNCVYKHMDDLAVCGYLILENLKAKTKIPFQAEQMDLTTLKHFYDAGLCKPLTVSYRRIIKQNKKSLRAYSGVLDLMLKYNCKEEQESLQVLEIFAKEN